MNQSTKKQAQLEKSTGGQVQALKETVEQLQAQIISVRESYEAKIREIAGAERESAKSHWAEELNRLRKVNEQMSKDMVALSDESELATTKLKEKNMEMLRELALVHKSQLEEALC
jgi:cupin superfamily acireductone dioxygenase involved in methionine salvage